MYVCDVVEWSVEGWKAREMRLVVSGVRIWVLHGHYYTTAYVEARPVGDIELVVRKDRSISPTSEVSGTPDRSMFST